MSSKDTEFLALILEGDRRQAQSYLREALEQCGVELVYEAIVQPALAKVGALWVENRIGIADEHLATATAESAVAALYPFFPWPRRGPKAVIACAQGERHQLGARMVADLLALDGWDDRFLGADVPAEELARKVRELEPKMVALSVTVPHHIAAARSTIELVRVHYPSVKILVGGRATTEPAAAQSFGADAFASSGSQAVEVARAWK